MKVSIPIYLNGKEVRNYKTEKIDCIDLNLDCYVVSIQTLDDINILIKDFKKPTEYEEFIQDIQTKDTLQIFIDKYNKFKDDYKRAKKDVPDYVLHKLKTELNELNNTIKETNKNSMTYLKEHIEDVKQYIQTIIEDKKEKLKQKNREASKKYYLLKKQELSVNLISTPELTAEEKYEKKKQAQREANKRYYAKVKQEISAIKETSPEYKLTPIQEQRKVWNKKYYQSKKELLAQLAMMSSGAGTSTGGGLSSGGEA